MPGRYDLGLSGITGQIGQLVDSLAPEHTLPDSPGKGTFWYHVRNAIANAYLERAGAEARREGKAIIMAGSPGAGKSHGPSAVREALGPAEAARTGLDEDGFITVDADDVKQILLGNLVPGLAVDQALVDQARRHWDGIIAQHAPQRLSDGQPLLRGELAVLVHRLSNSTINQALEDLLDARINVKIEGTLQWEGRGPELVQRLKEADYTQVSLVAVNAPVQTCLAGARTRWTGPRSRGEVTARYTPEQVVLSTFEPDGSNRCITNARTAHQLARQRGNLASADLFVIDRATRPPTIEHTDHDGLTHLFTPSSEVSSPTRAPAANRSVTRDAAARSSARAYRPRPPRRRGIGR